VFIGTACAGTVTVAFNEPTSGQTFSTTTANRATIDVNFRVTDDNADATDFNIDCRWYPASTYPTDGTFIADDWNALVETNADQNCFGPDWVTGKDCTIRWTMPLDSTMPEDDYYLDCNVYEYNDPSDLDWPGDTLGDANGTVQIRVQNRISTIETVKSLLLNQNLILAAVVLITILAVGLAMSVDPMKLALVAVTAAVAVAIGSMIVGTVVAAM